MSKEKSNSSIRTRNFATVVYPESAPLCWMDMLIDLKIPCFVSPLHDSDINPNGEAKKPHYHVMVMFDSVKTRKQAEKVFETIGGVGCEVINSMRAYARYLCHLDNPEKYQYNINQVSQFGGADYMTVIGTMSDRSKAIREMIQFIKENDIRYFCDMLEICSEKYSEWFDCLVNSGSFVIKEFIKSYTYKMKDKEVNSNLAISQEKLAKLRKDLDERFQNKKN